MPALPFIVIDEETGEFTIDKQAADFLERIDGPIAVVACAGKYRTGKSSLLNRVLLDVLGKDGFGVGKTVNACTKGLWLHTKILGVPRDNGSTVNVLIVDSEGLGAFNATDSHDSRIFALALLVSSYFVYNSVGTIDEQAISTLSLVANISKHVRARANENSSNAFESEQQSELSDARELGTLFPDFLWVVRDFSLQLCSTDGSTLNANQYLEHALSAKQAPPNASEEQIGALEEKNHLRDLLRAYFPRRQCATLVRPCANESDLQRVDNLPKSEMRPEFWQDARALRNSVLRNAPPKTVANNKPVSGRGLLRLCQAFIDALNSGAAPVIRDSWALLAEVQFRDAIEHANEAFRALVEQQSGDSACHPNQLEQILRESKRRAMLQFAKEAPESSGPQFEKFNSKLDEQLRDLCEDAMRTNEKLMRDSIERILLQQVESTLHKHDNWNEFVESVWRPAQQRIAEQIGTQSHSLYSEIALPVLERAAETIFAADSGAKKQILQLTEQLEEAEHRLQCVDEQQAKIDDLREERATLQAQLAVEREEAQRCEKELLAQIEKHSARSLDVDTLRESDAWLEHEAKLRADLEEQARVANERADSTQWRLDEANERIERDTNNFNEQLSALRLSTEESLATIRSATQGEIEACEQRCEKLQSLLNESQGEREREVQQRQSLKRKFDEASLRLSQVEEQLAAQRKEQSANERAFQEKWRADIEERSEAQMNLLKDLKETQARLAARETQIAALRAEIDTEKPNIEAERARAVCEQLEREAERLRTELIELRSVEVARNATIRSLENQLRDQTREHEMAQLKLRMDYEVARAQKSSTSSTSGPSTTQSSATIVSKRSRF